MTVLETNDITLSAAPSVSDAIDFAKHGQSRRDSHVGTPCRSEIEKSECNSAIVEHHQQMTITLSDAPLVWQAVRDAEAGFPVEAAQILAGTFDFQTYNCQRMAEKIGRYVAEHAHDDHSFMEKFHDQLCSVLEQLCSLIEYTDNVVMPTVSGEAAKQAEHFSSWLYNCFILAIAVSHQIKILRNSELEQLRLEVEQRRQKNEQRHQKEQQWLSERDDLFRSLPIY